MGGQDKGLVSYQGRLLAAWVLDRLVPQSAEQAVIANRNLAAYRSLLLSAQEQEREHEHALVPAVWPDAPDLPAASGPLAGIITGLRHTHTPWMMVMPCDTPHLPADLVERLWLEGERTGADAVVPTSLESDGALRHHWACVLLRKRVFPQVSAQFLEGGRRIGACIQSLNWVSVSFEDAAAFANINSLETLNGHD